MSISWEHKFRTALMTGVLGVPLVLSACSQTINPKPATPEYSEAFRAKNTFSASDYSYEVALAYIDIAKSRMRDYADGPTKTRNIAGAGGILAAVGAVAAALFDAHEDLYFGLGLGGGSLLAVSNLYGNPAFEEVYENGLSALACVDHKMRDTLVAGAAIEADTTDVPAAVKAVEDALVPVFGKKAKADASIDFLQAEHRDLNARRSKKMEMRDQAVNDFNAARAAYQEAFTEEALKSRYEGARDVLAKAKAELAAVEEVKKQVASRLAEIESAKELLFKYLDYPSDAQTKAQQLLDDKATVRASELAIASQVVTAVDNIFLQVRKKIRDVDPGSQGIANTIATIGGFANLSLPKAPKDNDAPDGIIPPSALSNGGNQAPAMLSPAVPSPGGLGEKAFGESPAVNLPSAEQIELDQSTFDAMRDQFSGEFLTPHIAEAQALVLTAEERNALILETRSLVRVVAEGVRGFSGVKEAASRKIDISDCNVAGATIVPFSLLNAQATVGADKKDPTAIPTFNVDTSAGAATFNLAVHGGQPNYSYEIIGAVPANVTVLQARGGQYLIQAGNGATGTLTLHLYDSGTGSIVIAVKFGNTPSEQAQAQVTLSPNAVNLDTSSADAQADITITGEGTFAVNPDPSPPAGITVTVTGNTITVSAPMGTTAAAHGYNVVRDGDTVTSFTVTASSTIVVN